MVLVAASRQAGYLSLGLVVGLAAGAGGFTFYYGRGFSYLGHDAAACANCHVMRDRYEGWLRGSHHGAAVCNDCHTPELLIPKYAVKGANGLFHSYAFTSGRFPEPIRIKAFNKAVTLQRCRGCHGPVVALMERRAGQSADCTRCHAHVGHVL
jgi:cytochrome c nitrite reductase small subunit